MVAASMLFTSFNSILVQLEAKYRMSLQKKLLSFNSILVQLEGLTGSLPRYGMPCFNSILVQLEVKFLRYLN